MEKRKEFIENIGIIFIGCGLIAIYLCVIISMKLMVLAAPLLSIGAYLLLGEKLKMNSRFLIFSLLLATIGGIAWNTEGFEVAGVLLLILLGGTYIMRAVKYELI